VDFNLGDLFEQAADTWPEREYLVANGQRRTYAEMEARANRMAHHLAAHGVGAGDHVGIYGLNSVEWVETLWAVFKLRATWVNINYRYVEEELAYLFGNADLVALVYEEPFAGRVLGVRERLPLLRHSVVIGDGSSPEAAALDSVPYEDALAGGSPSRDFAPRSADDRYILFTGGTTGLPKGVVWRHGDVIMALGGGIDMRTGERVRTPADFVAKGLAGGPLVSYPIAPLMHGATQWSVMGGSFTGNKIVLSARFDPAAVWSLVGAEGVNLLMITGDAMARPLIEELRRPGVSYDLSTLFAVSSTAARFSQVLKDELLERLPHLVVTDAIGSSETGGTGLTLVAKGVTMRGGPTVTPIADAVVLDESLKPLPPGSGVVGRVARGGNIPLGYYKDDAKTAETFVVAANGKRYALAGDFGLVEADGSITLLGRGSVSINSGGEKIFPEEVEAAVVAHPEVYDAIVVGMPDPRWGERVTAVVQPRPGTAPTLESIQDHCRTRIAGYKVPRYVVLVERVERSPSGKPDYPWAAAVARDALLPAEVTETDNSRTKPSHG
jgi:acyl-CoA synthetase (AMP-forming)/AMP-acid ligase II